MVYLVSKQFPTVQLSDLVPSALYCTWRWRVPRCRYLANFALGLLSRDKVCCNAMVWISPRCIGMEKCPPGYRLHSKHNCSVLGGSSVRCPMVYLTTVVFRGVPDLCCFSLCTWTLLTLGPDLYCVSLCTWPLLCSAVFLTSIVFPVYLTSIVFLCVSDLYCVKRCTWPLFCSAVYLTPIMFRGVPDPYYAPRCTWPLVCSAVYLTAYLLVLGGFSRGDFCR